MVWRLRAGVVHDPAARVAGVSLHRQLLEARHRHCGLRPCLQEPHVAAEPHRCATARPVLIVIVVYSKNLV